MTYALPRPRSWTPEGAAHINEPGARNALELERVEDGYRLIIFGIDEETVPAYSTVLHIVEALTIPTLFAHFEDIYGPGYFSTLLDLRYDTGELSLAECMEALLLQEEDLDNWLNEHFPNEEA